MLRIPEHIWTEMLAVFREVDDDIEQVAFLDGYRCEELGAVTTLVVPGAVSTAGYYSVSAEAMHEAGAHLREHGMVRLAQVHTHPADWVGLSPRDKSCAYSQRDGSISIVLPSWGRADGPIESIGVHERTPDGWHVLEADRTLLFVPSLIDLRSKPWNQSQPVTKAISTAASTPWARIRKGFISLLTRTTRGHWRLNTQRG